MLLHKIHLVPQNISLIIKVFLVNMNGFDLSDYDLRCLSYAKDYAVRLLSIDVNIPIEEMLDTAWELFAKYFSPAETGIKQVFIDKYWKS